MRRKHYWLALLAIPAVWLYTLARSAGELLAVLPAPTVSVRAAPVADPSVPQAVASSSLRAEPSTAEPAEVVAPSIAATPPAAAPTREAQPFPELAPAVYAPQSAEPATENVPHPEITDPRMRKLLQPAWDD